MAGPPVAPLRGPITTRVRPYFKVWYGLPIYAREDQDAVYTRRLNFGVLFGRILVRVVVVLEI